MLTYNHYTIHKWVQTNFMNQKNILKIKSDNYSKAITCHDNQRITFVENLLNGCIVNGCAEFCHVSALFNLQGNNSSIGFSYSKIFLEQSLDSRDYFYEAYLPNLLFSNRLWETEILIESFWWSFKGWTEPPPIPKKLHVWGTPIFLGMALLKIGTCEQKITKLDILLDTLKLEWCIELGEYVILAVRYVDLIFK